MSTLSCPTCKKLGLPDSFFCTQDCFKSNWIVHKITHQTTTNPPSVPEKLPEHFAGYRFTGPLRPGIVSPMNSVPDHIQKPQYASTGIPQKEKEVRGITQIEIKTPEQIEAMKIACRYAREVLDIAAQHVRVGVTTDEIDKIVHVATLQRNAYPSPLNYNHFPKSCCTSINEVICHGIPDSRPLQDGDICNIDITVYYNGFHGDVNETFLVGNVDEESKTLVRVTRECLEKAIAIVKPGTLYREVGNVISRHANKHGFSVVRSYCGHGIGSLFHTAPSIPHYSKNKAIGVMKPGHTFTIEPMINQGFFIFPRTLGRSVVAR